LFRRPARPSFTPSRSAAFPPSRARLLKRTASRRPRPPIKAGGSRPYPRPTARNPIPTDLSHFPGFRLARDVQADRVVPPRLRGRNSAIRDLATHHAYECDPCRPTSRTDGLHFVQAREALKANTTNFRIARRSLPISRAYLRTIERTPSILLVSLLIGKADCR
jgi:hypothetical protein